MSTQPVLQTAATALRRGPAAGLRHRHRAASGSELGRDFGEVISSFPLADFQVGGRAGAHPRWTPGFMDNGILSVLR